MDIPKLIRDLTLTEKCSLVVGRDAWHTVAIPRLGIPAIMMADGPTGLRKQLDSGTGVQAAESYRSVCYPPAATVAASFDIELAEAMGSAIADECRAKDVQVLLAPGVNIKRSPLCGRNFEYYSEDPHLSGEMGAAFIRGVEKKNVGACVKHFALNNQESFRMTSSSVCDRRTFREIYTPAFARCVQENPAMVMCSYNRIDGVYAAENRFLLQDTLRSEFGFENVIVSDWSAVSDRGKSVCAGLDLEMPGHAYAVRKLEKDVTKGIVAISELDACVKRVLCLVDKYGANPLVDTDLDENHRKAREIAAGSIVLLKNEDAILPLSEDQTIAVVGKLAETPRYQGGGSSHVNPFRVDAFLDFIPAGVLWEYAEGYHLEGDGYDQVRIDQAKAICLGKAKVILFVGLTDEYESEGYDRTHLSLPFGHEELIRQVAAVNENVVVVLQIGSPVTMPWIHQVKGVVNGYLGGEAGAGAIADVLYGKITPSGRLPETFPLDPADAPGAGHFAVGNARVLYQESIYVGYRYYETKLLPVLFPFGYGLSYTEFSYANLVLSGDLLTVPGTIEAAIDVTNVGSVGGREVIQWYVENAIGAVFRPTRELRGFAKISLKPGETKTVKRRFSEADFSYFDPAAGRFVAAPGDYRIVLMKNASEAIVSIALTIQNPDAPAPDPALLLATSYLPAKGLIMTAADFATLLGHDPGPESERRKRPFTMDDCLDDLKKTLLGRLLIHFVTVEAKKAITGTEPAYQRMVLKSMLEVPLRSLAVQSGGKLGMRTALAIIDWINIRPFAVLARLFGRD